MWTDEARSKESDRILFYEDTREEVMGEESQESNLKYLKEKIRGIQSCFTYFRACQREKRNYMAQKYAI